jgi:AraC-like DNA-binding protein
MKTTLNHVRNWHELARQANWCVSNLAKECGVSPRTLERYFKDRKWKTPKDWLIEQRQKDAMLLIRNGALVKEVAGQLGHKYAQHFSREFKQFWGYCPSMNKQEASKTKNVAFRADIFVEK